MTQPSTFETGAAPVRPQAYYVYILCCADQSLYTGLTTDPGRRLQEHQAGGAKAARYTRCRLPVKQVWLSQALPNRQAAAKLEYKIKRMSRGQKLSWIQSENCVLSCYLDTHLLGLSTQGSVK